MTTVRCDGPNGCYGEMETDGEIMLSLPPQKKYTCPNCGASKTVRTEPAPKPKRRYIPNRDPGQDF